MLSSSRVLRSTLKQHRTWYRLGTLQKAQQISHRHFSLYETLIVIPQTIQTGMVDLHSVTGLPWWGTFACATAIVRIGLLPLTRFQLLAARNLAKSLPEVNFLSQLLKERVKNLRGSSTQKTKELMSTIAVFRKGVRASFALNGVSLKKIFGLPILNIGIFATFVFSVRDILAGTIPSNTIDLVETGLELEKGGMFWFLDLTSKDTTLLLPVMALISSYGALEIAFAKVGAQGPTTDNMKGVMWFKDIIQTTIVLALPAYATLPAGVFCYWIPSSIMGALQSIAVRTELGQTILRIPPLPGQSSNKASKPTVMQ
jgi:YidC/Oxa1 family membrane protein insertase